MITRPEKAIYSKELEMSYAELLEKLQSLPSDKQAEVFDFVEFLSARFSPGSRLCSTA
jgi:hypothetical protein